MINARVGVIGLMLAGCAFNPPAPQGVEVDAGSGGEVDAGPVVAPRCASVADRTDLRLCLDFEHDQDPMLEARDDSDNHHDAAAITVVTAQRDEPGPVEKAAQFGLLSGLVVPETPDLDITDHLTMELWVQTALVPTGTRSWLIDSSDQYFLSIGDNEQVRCGIDKDKNVDANQAVPTDGHWHHVACTYDHDAEHGLLQVFIDGNLSDCELTDKLIANVAGGTTVGVKAKAAATTDHFVGLLDNVHVFARTLTAAEVCAAAGKPAGSCTATCPGGIGIGIGI